MGSPWWASAYIRLQLHHCPYILASSQDELLSGLLVISTVPKLCGISRPLSWLAFLLWTCFPCLLLQMVNSTFSFFCVSPWTLCPLGSLPRVLGPFSACPAPCLPLSLDLSHRNEMDLILPWHLFWIWLSHPSVSSKRAGTIPPTSLYPQMFATIWAHNLGKYVLTDKENKSKSVTIL